MTIEEKQKYRQSSLKGLIREKNRELEEDREAVSEFLKEVMLDLDDAYREYQATSDKMVWGKILSLLEEQSLLLEYDALLKEASFRMDELKDNSLTERPSIPFFQ